MPAIATVADEEGPVGLRHVLLEPAHLAHVLLAAAGVDHRARAEEEAGLEEGVGEDVEDAGDVGADPGGEEHVAELGDRRVGEHLLDVVLGEADGGREHRRDAADHRHRQHRGGAQLVEEVAARHHVDAGGDHGRGVDQGRDRGRAGHRVGQPDVQRQLRRLAHRADEEQHADDGGGGGELAVVVGRHRLVQA
jgi:hypothetical protein